MIAKTNFRNNTPRFIKPPKSGKGQSVKIFVGVRGFAHSKAYRRSYWLAVTEKGDRIAGNDCLLSRSTTPARALEFAQIQARNWQDKNNHTEAIMICLRPGTHINMEAQRA